MIQPQKKNQQHQINQAFAFKIRLLSRYNVRTMSKPSREEAMQAVKTLIELIEWLAMTQHVRVL